MSAMIVEVAIAISFTNDMSFTFRVKKCDEPGCKRFTGRAMGHDYCGEHCLCLRGDLVYDPLRCVTCREFINNGFIGITDITWIKTATAELERHIRKLRKFAFGLEGNRYVKFSSFMDELRRQARASQVNVDFFRNLSFGEKTGESRDDAVSQKSGISGILNSPVAYGRSHESPRPGRSSPSKTSEDMAMLKGQIASMQDAISKLITLPSNTANVSSHE